jgi:hypothetical protein
MNAFANLLPPGMGSEIPEISRSKSTGGKEGRLSGRA